MKITRSKAIALLRGLEANQIASVTFVARGDEKTPPYVRTMAFRTGVTRHLKGGHRRYDSAEHALFGVFEVVNRATALARYRDKAQHEIDEVRPLVAPAQAAVEAARKELTDRGGPTGKGNKGRVQALGVKERRLASLETKLAHAELKIADPKAALTDELTASIGRRQEEIAELVDTKLPAARAALAAGDPDGTRAALVADLEHQLSETRDRLARTREYLKDPEESLLARYRQINLTGLLELRIAGKVYKVSTPPQPAVPTDAQPKDEDPGEAA